MDDARPSATTKIHEPKTLEERTDVAGNCAEDLGLELPLLIDDMEDTVSTAYSAHPDRLFILGIDGKIAYTGAKGPHGFDVSEMVAALEEMVAAE